MSTTNSSSSSEAALAASSSLVTTLLDWTYGGVDFLGPGNNGGPECRDHVPGDRRLMETLVGLSAPAMTLLLMGSTSTSANEITVQPVKKQHHHYSLGRIFLLVTLSFVFGIEVGYKFATKQLIFLLNPCHIMTVLELYILAAPADLFRFNVTLFRTMLHYLHGPLAAILFPVTECLHMPFEKETYWIQHVLLLVVPFYLLLGDKTHNYVAYKPFDMIWLLRAYLAWAAWHWIVLQGVGYLTLANVGSMLCAAPSDPFHGPYYRLFGVVHQFLAIAVFGTLAAILARWGREKKEA